MGDRVERGRQGRPGPYRDVVIALSPSWVLREEEDGEALLFDADTGAEWVANRTAVAVWKLVDGRRRVNDLLDELRRSYEGFDDAASTDVEELLAELIEAGALTASS